jgi:hypothetical protein
MTDNKLTLAPNFSIPAVDYAGQGNAILGIRDAGKTYTAMKAAEELLDNKIPIIVYDPVGVWKNLKIGTGKHNGYPIVVAGGEGSDIRLNVNNACDIVRAAMKENVSLVIDLYSPELINKSSWIRIVQETVDLLMYENKDCGLRHIFIEEAAEFIPQRLNQQHFKVYASIERLARMGRNARLGYTLINQRAEEVNKAILEISAFSLLHKQVGKNSLKSIQQWMELLQVENSKEIIQSLPALKQGECWVIGMNSKPHKIKISERKTFHPDPKKNIDTKQVSMLKLDVSSFVEKLNKRLAKPADKIADKKAPVSVDAKKQELEINSLKLEILSKDQEIAELKNAINTYEKRATHFSIKLIEISENLTDSWKAPDKVISSKMSQLSKIGTNDKKIDTKSPNSGTNVHKNDTNVREAETMARNTAPSLNIPTGEKKILIACRQYPEGLRREQLTVLTAYKRSSRNSYIQRLKEKGYLEETADRVYISKEGIKALGNNYEPLPTGEKLQEYWLGNLPTGERAILEVLLSYYPKTVTRDTLSEETGYMRSSRDTYIQRMTAKEIITIVGRGEVKASENLFN